MMCRLCLKNRKLCDSHVIPEFLYRPLYDSKHRAFELRLEPFRERYLQKGYREQLLCDECEAKIAKYEQHFAHTWYAEGKLPDEVRGDELVIEGLDYAAFKLFHLSGVVAQVPDELAAERVRLLHRGLGR